MEGLVVMLSLVIGAVLATGVSMAGLRLITSFVPGPGDPEPAHDAAAREESAPRPATT